MAQFVTEPLAAVASHLEAHGLHAEPRADDQPGIPHLVRTHDPDGLAIDLYAASRPGEAGPPTRGVAPHKLSHVATLCPDIRKALSFYTDVLGFRLSDAIGDVFYFLRCGADHHTVNLLSSKRAGLQHVAFELNDVSHVARACDVLARNGIETLWCPAARRGPQRRRLPPRSGEADRRVLRRARPHVERGAGVLRSQAMARRHAAAPKGLGPEAGRDRVGAVPAAGRLRRRRLGA